MIKLRFVEFLMALSWKLFALSQKLEDWSAQLYGVRELYRENDGLPPDNRIFFLLKKSDGAYNFHGIVAEDREDARQQAWKIPGSLLVLNSVNEFRIKLIAEAHRRRHG